MLITNTMMLVLCYGNKIWTQHKGTGMPEADPSYYVHTQIQLVHSLKFITDYMGKGRSIYQFFSSHNLLCPYICTHMFLANDTNAIASVSYTHLDVYKRQKLCCLINTFALGVSVIVS